MADETESSTSTGGGYSQTYDIKKAEQTKSLKRWRRDVLRWYPRLHSRSHFVPSVYLKRINFQQQQIGQETVAVQKPAVEVVARKTGAVSVSDQMEDHEQQRILHCLKKFCDKRRSNEGDEPEPEPEEEVMFVMSQLNFTSYLGEPCFAAAAKNFPRPLDLNQQNMDRGDFDFLFIHRRYGLMAAEVKSIGTTFTGTLENQAGEDKSLVKRLEQALKQLNKCGDVLKHLTQDMEDKDGLTARVSKTLMLPNISKTHLKRVLDLHPHLRQVKVSKTLLLPNIPKTHLMDLDPHLKQQLLECFDAPSTADVTDMCLTSEQLSPRREFWRVSDDVIQGLDRWWRRALIDKGDDPWMSERNYEDLVAMFCGPATKVEVFCPSAVQSASKAVRSEGDAVSETGARFMDLVLYQQQVDILHAGERLVYLAGPPGTGKSVVLMIQAEQWLKEGKDVHVVSIFSEALAASLYMANCLRAKCGNAGAVHFHSFDLGLQGHEEAVRTLASCAKDGQLFVVVDEVDASLGALVYPKAGDRSLEFVLWTTFEDFCSRLCEQVAGLHLWAVRLFYNLALQMARHGFKEHQLRLPVRFPGGVAREVNQSDFMHYDYEKLIRGYDDWSALSHTDGPDVKELRHEGCGHLTDVTPTACEECGYQLALVLKDLHVGEFIGHKADSKRPKPLQYRDVFVLTMTDKVDGLVNGLQKADIPIRRYHASPQDTMSCEDLALMTGPDAVVVADMRYVAGLERKIVACVHPAVGDEQMENIGRFRAFSRTSSQLILLSAPTPVEAPVNLPLPAAITIQEDQVALLESIVDEMKEGFSVPGNPSTTGTESVLLTVVYEDGRELSYLARICGGTQCMISQHDGDATRDAVADLECAIKISATDLYYAVDDPNKNVPLLFLRNAIQYNRIRGHRIHNFVPVLHRAKQILKKRLGHRKEAEKATRKHIFDFDLD